jgi:hypothetical protein
VTATCYIRQHVRRDFLLAPRRRTFLATCCELPKTDSAMILRKRLPDSPMTVHIYHPCDPEIGLAFGTFFWSSWIFLMPRSEPGQADLRQVMAMFRPESRKSVVAEDGRMGKEDPIAGLCFRPHFRIEREGDHVMRLMRLRSVSYFGG